MSRSWVLLLIGFGMGAGSVYLLATSPEGARLGLVPVPPVQMSCDDTAHTVDHKDVLVIHNEQESSHALAASGGSPLPVVDRVLPTATAGADSDQAPERAMAWRISAIEKFVPLSEEQRERLKEKFEEERVAREEGRESQAESLETVIGEENASMYRQQVQAAFERVQNEEIEKEVVWVARKLSLSSDQEQGMRAAFASVESTINSEFGGEHGQRDASPQTRVSRMIAENKRRLQLRADAAKGILNAEQYAAYVESEAQSSAADMEVFHDPGQ
jgi:hypothetical protein